MITAIMPNRPEYLKDRPSQEVHIEESLTGVASCNCLITLIQRHTKPLRMARRYYDGSLWAATILIKH